MAFRNDNELIEAIRNRDREAFKYLYKNYTGAIKQFVIKSGGEEFDAEEIEQEVIILLYEKIVSGKFVLKEGTKLSTYMYAVGKNMYYKMCRKKGIVMNSIDGSFELPESVDIDIDNFLDDPKKNEKEVIGAIEELNQDCRDILTMFYYDKMSMRDISKKMGTISEDNVRKRKFRCLEKLRNVLINKINIHE